MVNYLEAKIYQIVNSVNDTIYIGSTCQLLSKRMSVHRAYALYDYQNVRKLVVHKQMAELGVDKFRILLIKNYPCTTKAELESEEYRVMQEYLKNGTKLYNVTIEYGKMAESVKMKISGERNYRFSRGCIYYNKICGNWEFRWCVRSRAHSKSFSIKKYGYNLAQYLAEVERECHYPCKKYGGKLPVLEL